MDHLYKPRIRVTEMFDAEKFSNFSQEINHLYNHGSTLEEILQKNTEKIGVVSGQTMREVLDPKLKELNEPFFLHKMKEIPVPAIADSFKCVRRALGASKSRRPKDRVQRTVLIEANPKTVIGLSAPKNLEEMIFTVKIFQPFKHISGSRKVPKIIQEFRLLGSQSLAVLKDNIRCYEGPFLDISENPDQEPIERQEDSGFIFVNTTFYNEFRSQKNVDYSDVIRKWYAEKNDFKQLDTAILHETQVKDLQFKTGFPYVYQHYGNCEHLLMFSDVRMVTQTEVKNQVQFPIVLSSSAKEVYCFVCGLSEATYVVQNSSEHIEDPSHLCTHCLHMYHYKDGKKLGSFKLYRLSRIR